jgi:hypothetical protein
MGSRLLFFVCVKGNGSASFLSNLLWWGLSVHQGLGALSVWKWFGLERLNWLNKSHKFMSTNTVQRQIYTDEGMAPNLGDERMYLCTCVNIHAHTDAICMFRKEEGQIRLLLDYNSVSQKFGVWHDIKSKGLHSHL